MNRTLASQLCNDILASGFRSSRFNIHVTAKTAVPNLLKKKNLNHDTGETDLNCRRDGTTEDIQYQRLDLPFVVVRIVTS